MTRAELYSHPVRVAARLLLLGGIPGTLKTSTALRLAADGDFFAAVSTDDLREALRQRSDDPFLAGTSHTRFELLGEYTPARLFEGFKRQAVLLQPSVEAVLRRAQERGCSSIVEGVHILPSLYRDADLPQVVLVERDRERLKSRLLGKFPTRPGLRARFDEPKLDQLLELQASLELDARRCGVTVWETASVETNAKGLASLAEWLR
jgi:2-phosphoglycerate kinase